jgi:hypothetical protein
MKRRIKRLARAFPNKFISIEHVYRLHTTRNEVFIVYNLYIEFVAVDDCKTLKELDEKIDKLIKKNSLIDNEMLCRMIDELSKEEVE